MTYVADDIVCEAPAGTITAETGRTNPNITLPKERERAVASMNDRRDDG
jgi:hypothetical protein